MEEKQSVWKFIQVVLFIIILFLVARVLLKKFTPGPVNPAQTQQSTSQQQSTSSGGG